MKLVVLVTAILSLLLVGCTTTTHGVITIEPEVQKMTYADERLFSDLLTQPGGVAHIDFKSFPRSKKKILSRIEVLTPYDNRKTGLERWFIEHEGGSKASYLVKMVPDGRGGTYFTVTKE